MRWKIYILRDPLTQEVRYVGVTHRTTNQRVTEHRYHARKRGARTHCACWLRSLAKKGLEPKVEIIEEGNGVWQEREIYWIAFYRDSGSPLTNHTDGGEGTLGYRPTPEARQKTSERSIRIHTGRKRSMEAKRRMSEVQKKIREEEAKLGIKRTYTRSAETLKRMSDAQKGKKASKETRRKLSEVRKNPSPETREKLRQAVLRRPLEQREAFAQNQKGKKKSPETKKKMSEARKAYWQRKRGGLNG